jgi:3-oxoacyl-(acyl-carrier-protein) synthase
LQLERREYVNCPIAAQALDFDPANYFSSKEIVPLDRFSQFSVAAREALADSGLDTAEDAVRHAPTIVGIGVGGLCTLDDAFYRVYHENVRRVHPFVVPRLMCNAAASQVSMHLGLHGLTYAVASACASGTHAIGQAFNLVRSGMNKVAFAGGSKPASRWARLSAGRRCGYFPTTPAARFQGTAVALFWGKARRCWCWRNGITRSRAEPPSTPKCWASAATPMLVT